MLIALAPAKALAEERRNTLLLSVAATAEEASRLEGVTRELLAPLAVQLELRRVPRVDISEMRRASASAYFARVWIALSAAGSARLFLEHGASDRLLVRDVPGNPDNPELLREELAHILLAAVEGLKAGEEVGEPRQEALQQVTPEAPPVAVAREQPAASPAEPRHRLPLGVGARYEARWLGEGARFEDGPGAVLQWTSPLGAELSGYYRRPLRVLAEPVGARLQTLTLRALVTLEAWRAARSRLRLGAGLGADFVRVRAVPGGAENLELAGASWLALALGRLQASYGYQAWPFLELQVSAGADVDVSDTSYVFYRPSGDVTVLDPAPVRPFLSLGATLP